jgi:hypothetical protein
MTIHCKVRSNAWVTEEPISPICKNPIKDLDREQLVSHAGLELLRRKGLIRTQQDVMLVDEDSDDPLIVEDFSSRPSTAQKKFVSDETFVKTPISSCNRRSGSGAKSARGRMVTSSCLKNKNYDKLVTTDTKNPLIPCANALRPSSSHCDFRRVNPDLSSSLHNLCITTVGDKLKSSASQGTLPRSQNSDRHDLKRPPSRKKVAI